MTLRTVEDVERITTRVKEVPTSAVVIGGAVIPAAIVIMAIGVRPNTSLANRYRV
jgi:NAD(P)H-nitrite reductase large subunit